MTHSIMQLLTKEQILDKKAPLNHIVKSVSERDVKIVAISQRLSVLDIPFYLLNIDIYGGVAFHEKETGQYIAKVEVCNLGEVCF